MQVEMKGDTSMLDDATGRAKGGIARRDALSPERRTEIAREAAAARWDDKTPTATHRGKLHIGGTVIPCAVLDTGKRVVTENGITVALLGSRSGASKRLTKRLKREGAPLPMFLAPGNLKDFISQELVDGPLTPIKYRDGERVVTAYDAEILPAACDVWLRAREAGKLQDQQADKAKQAEILMRGLAQTGIIALVDEATGYQEIRPRDALQQYLEMVLRKELAAWSKRFPDEFYENIYKLKGWKWPGMGKNRYSVVAHYTRDLIYERLGPGILKELEARSPKNEKGVRKNKFHQWLTDDIGHPLLAQHMHAILMFQRLAIANGHGWVRFHRTVDQVMPRKGQNLELPGINPDPTAP
jgi:hypothetical protein